MKRYDGTSKPGKYKLIKTDKQGRTIRIAESDKVDEILLAFSCRLGEVLNKDGDVLIYHVSETSTGRQIAYVRCPDYIPQRATSG